MLCSLLKRGWRAHSEIGKHTYMCIISMKGTLLRALSSGCTAKVLTFNLKFRPMPTNVWGGPLLTSKRFNWKWLTKDANVYKRVIWVLILIFNLNLNFILSLPPPIKRSSSISSFQMSACYSFKKYIRIYCSSTNQDVQMQQHPCCFCGPANNRLQAGGTCQAGGYSLHNAHRGVVVSSQREASWFSLSGPCHLSIDYWPLQLSPKYLWLNSMHRLNPF